MISKSDILEIANLLCDYNALFYNAWLLGTPVLDESIPTACIEFDKTGRGLVYKFNPTFWEGLNQTERMFLFSHEILHLFLHHGYRSAAQSEKDAQILNIAMDLSINHLLVEQFGFKREDMPTLGENLCWVDGFLGKNAETGHSFEYYFNQLKKKIVDIDIPGLIVLSGGLGGINGQEIPEEALELLGNYINTTLGDELKKKLGEIQNNQQPTGKFAGSGHGNVMLDFSTIKVIKKKTWEQLIKKLTKTHDLYKDVDLWSPKNRRVMHLSNDLFLPSSYEVEDMDRAKAEVWVFLDTSGSCYTVSKRFYTALKSIPEDKFVIRSFGFDDQVYEVKNGRLYGFGGTSFWIIENHIKQEIEKTKKPYPQMVFVITDGYGNDVTPEKPERWHWFLTKWSSTGCIPKECTIHYLSDYDGGNEFEEDYY